MSVFLVCDHEPMHHKYITFKYINILGLSRSQDSSVSIPGSHSPYIGSAVDTRRWLQNGDPIKRTKVVTVWSGCCIGYTHTTSKEGHDSVRNGNWHAIRIYCTVTLQSIVQKERERLWTNDKLFWCTKTSSSSLLLLMTTFLKLKSRVSRVILKKRVSPNHDSQTWPGTHSHIHTECDGVHLGKVCKKNFLANSLLKMGSFNIWFNKKKHFLELSSFDEQEAEISPNWF